MSLSERISGGMQFLWEAIHPYLRRRIVTILLLGFVSGLPLLLTLGTLSAWLREAGVERSAIGLFALVGLPYALKPFWAPLMDGLRLPLLSRVLGRRRGWMLLAQFALMGAIVALAFSDPAHTPLIVMASFAVLVAFFSASQDIVIDAYRIETLDESEQGVGAAALVYGYRMGMLVAGAGALVLADIWTWTASYIAMAAMILVGVVTVLLSPEPPDPRDAEGTATETSPLTHAGGRYGRQVMTSLTPFIRAVTLGHAGLERWIMTYIVAPFVEFASRPGWLLILLFIVTFKLGDAFLGIMTNPFYIDLGFTKTEIAEVTKLFGVLALAVGLFLGGMLMLRIGLLPTLMVTGILQALSNLIFSYQAMMGNDLGALTITIAVENIAGGMGTAAFVAYLSSLTNTAFTATQFALLTALTAVGRTFLVSPSGFVVDAVGWFDFFILSVGVALPGLILLAILMRWFPDHAGRHDAGEGSEVAKEAG